jgi:hypothetical protein
MIKAMSDHSPKSREVASQQARADLKKLGAGDSVFTGALGPIRRAGTHFSGQDDPADDAIEIWGKRIGRLLSLIGVFGLGLYLYLTYFK